MTGDTFDKFQPPDRGRFGDNELALDPRRHFPVRADGAVAPKVLELKQHAQTPAAILVSDGQHGHKPVWLPRREIEFEDTGRNERVWNDDYRHHAPVVKVTLPEWLARSKGLL